MNVQMSSLELQWRDRGGGNGRTMRRYLDFVVDEQSLFQLIRADLIGRLGWLSADYDRSSIAQLLLQAPPDLKSGRYLLYICPECGDISCGAVTIAIEETSSHFVWRNFGYENDYEDTIHSYDRYASIGPFYFDKLSYGRILKTYSKQISD